MFIQCELFDFVFVFSLYIDNQSFVDRLGFMLSDPSIAENPAVLLTHKTERTLNSL